MLEVLVHADSDILPDGYLAFPVDIPDDDIRIGRVEDYGLPPDWRTAYPPTGCQLLGGKWLTEKTSSVLSVPSVVVPEERNYLLNPAHSEFGQIKINPGTLFLLNPRLFK